MKQTSIQLLCKLLIILINTSLLAMEIPIEIPNTSKSNHIPKTEDQTEPITFSRPTSLNSPITISQEQPSVAPIKFTLFSQDAAFNPLSKTKQLEDSQPRLHLCYDSPNARVAAHHFACCPDQLKQIVKIQKSVFSNLKQQQKTIHALNKIATKRKIVLVGPPGSGKTMLAKSIAIELEVGYCLRSAPAIPNEYKNSGITKLDELFSLLFGLEEPVVLILDELSGLTNRQHGTQRDPDPGMIEHFLTLLDRCEEYPHIMIIMTANDVKSLPAPLKSRLHGAIFEIKYPGFEECKKIIKLYLGDVPHKEPTESEMKKLAIECSRLSGREINHAVQLAAAKVLAENRNQIEYNDLEEGIKSVNQNRSLTSEWLVNFKEHLKTVFSYGVPLAGLALTGLGLYLQWKSRADQQLLASKQMKQAAFLHVQQLIHNAVMQRKHAFEQAYKEAWQLFLRMRSNDRLEAYYAVQNFLKGNESESFENAVAASLTIANGAQSQAGLNNENLMKLIAEASAHAVDTLGEDNGKLRVLLEGMPDVSMPQSSSKSLCSIV